MRPRQSVCTEPTYRGVTHGLMIDAIVKVTEIMLCWFLFLGCLHQSMCTSLRVCVFQNNLTLSLLCDTQNASLYRQKYKRLDIILFQ